MGLDASKAIERARSRSVSRVGRKRLRDAPSAGGAEAMEVDGSRAPQKRIHSAKSRCAFASCQQALFLRCQASEEVIICASATADMILCSCNGKSKRQKHQNGTS